MNKEELKNKLVDANNKYRLGKESGLSDQEYDDLCESYSTMVSEEEYSKFRNTLNEGNIESSRNKVIHKYITGSLDKIKAEEPENVSKFLKKYIKNELCVSAKIDGLSGIAKYVNGFLVGFSTRGDGTKGENIYNKAYLIKYLPKKINIKDELFIRGELVILAEDYDKIDGSSARNVVAGLINRKEFEEKDIENISFISYTIMGPKYSKKEQFKILEDNGFKTSWYKMIDKNEILSENFNDYLFNTANTDYGVKTDGLVLCDSEYHNEEKYRPDSCCAYKINQQTFFSILNSVEWAGPSMNGKFTPVGNINPVEVGGVVVSKVTLNNIDFINNFGLKIGSTVKCIRSGDVIPKLIDVMESSQSTSEISLPTTCPCCGSKLIQDGPFLYCMNDDCTDKTTNRVVNFIKKLEIEFASYKTLINFGIHNIKDLLNFSADINYKTEVKFINELNTKMFNKSKRELFCSLGMKDFSEITLNTIIDFYGWDAIESHEIEKTSFTNLPVGIGDITINKFIDGYKKILSDVELIVNDSRYVGNDKVEIKVEKTGISVCFTGKLETMGRTEASKLAISKGWEVKSSVTAGLTYLVTNTPDSGTSKNKKAQQLGTKIITEAEFLKLMS